MKEKFLVLMIVLLSILSCEKIDHTKIIDENKIEFLFVVNEGNFGNEDGSIFTIIK